MARIGDVDLNLSTAGSMSMPVVPSTLGYFRVNSNGTAIPEYDYTTQLWNGPPTVAVVEPERTRKKRERRMRGLYEVFVINPIKASVIEHEYIVAADEITARVAAAKNVNLSTNDLDDFDFIVRRIGDVRPKERVKEVRVLKD